QDVAGYTSEVNGFDITNTRADKKDIEITKTWLDDNSKERPKEIKVDLFRSIVGGDKEKVDSYTLTAKDDWKLTVKDLPSFDKDGKAYAYEIFEEEIDGYETTINGFDITNLRIGSKDVSGMKTWKGDKKSDRPDAITVERLQAGEVLARKEVTKQDDWKFVFKDLPKYDDEGKVITYTVDEQPIVGYDTSIKGFNITNTFNLEDAELILEADPNTIV